MNVAGIQRDWFTFSKHTLPDGNELPLATIKPEYEDALQSYCQEALRQQGTKKPYQKPELSDAQLKQLNEKYPDSDMSAEEYQLFLRDLVAMGVMTEQDMFQVGGTLPGGLCPVIPVTMVSICEAAPAGSEQRASLPFYDGFSKNDKEIDITQWAKYRAAYDTFYLDHTGASYESNENQLFQSIEDVLSQMTAARLSAQ